MSAPRRPVASTMPLWRRILWWALDLQSPSLACADRPCRFTWRGAVRGTFDTHLTRRERWGRS